MYLKTEVVAEKLQFWVVNFLTVFVHMDSGADAVWIQGRAVMLIWDLGHGSWYI
jgi:hypothetical protein